MASVRLMLSPRPMLIPTTLVDTVVLDMVVLDMLVWDAEAMVDMLVLVMAMVSMAVNFRLFPPNQIHTDSPKTWLYHLSFESINDKIYIQLLTLIYMISNIQYGFQSPLDRRISVTGN